MAITPGPGYMIDPSNPNNVIPIGSASTVNNPNAALISGGSNAVSPATQPFVPTSTYGTVNTNPTPTPPPATSTGGLQASKIGTGNLSVPSGYNVPDNQWVSVGGNLYTSKGGTLYLQSGAPSWAAGQAKDISTFASAPQQTSIGNPANPPTTSGTPAFTPATGASTAAQYTTSVQAQLDAQKQQLADAYKQQQAASQAKIDALTKQQADLQQLQDSGMASENTAATQEIQQKQAAYAQEQQQFQDNYQANQALVNEMDGLLTTGNQIVEDMKNTTGLSSIMQPRIAKTMSDVAARVGVIQAVMAARNSQIGQAQNQLKTALDAITSIANDQINYYKDVINFYQSQKSENAAQLASLSKDQQSYIDAQVKQLQDNITNAQNTANIVSKAMLDPTTAMAYAKAGVSLTDSVSQISQKLATYEQAQQLQWGAPHIVGSDYVQTNKVTGETRTVASIKTPSNSVDIGPSLSDAKDAISKGADPNAVKQAFLKDHPANASDWNNYFTATDPSKETYPSPTPTATKPWWQFW